MKGSTQLNGVAQSGSGSKSSQEKDRDVSSPMLVALIMDWIMRKALTGIDVCLEGTNGRLNYAERLVTGCKARQRPLKMKERKLSYE